MIRNSITTCLSFEIDDSINTLMDYLQSTGIINSCELKKIKFVWHIIKQKFNGDLMEEKKKRILSSILIGKNKVDKYLNEYKNLTNDNKIKFDIDIQNSINSKFEQFQINLYNYARSIVDKSEYFENSNKIVLLFNEVIVPKNLK